MYRLGYIRQLVFAILAGSMLTIATLVLISNVYGKHQLIFNTSAANNRDSYDPDLNTDGTKIVFESDTDFLGECVLDNQFEIWLYDTISMTYTRVTTSFDNSVINHNAHISSDGTKIAYRNQPNTVVWFKVSEIMLFDTTLVTSTRIGTTTAVFNPGDYLAISADGTKIAFEYDSDLHSPPNNQEIWLYDVATMTYTHKITNTGNGSSVSPSLNTDGTKIAFNSTSDFLGQGSSQYEVWLYDANAMTYTRITTASSIGRRSGTPSINDDGTKIAFESDSDILGQGIVTGQREVWLYDTVTMTYTRITTASDVDRASGLPDISDDGTKIVFASDSDFFGQGIEDGQNEIWLYDMLTMKLTRVTTATINSSKGIGIVPRISGDGVKIVFASDSDFLNEGIINGQFEVWVYDTTQKSLSRITTARGNPCTTYLPLVVKNGS